MRVRAVLDMLNTIPTKDPTPLKLTLVLISFSHATPDYNRDFSAFDWERFATIIRGHRCGNIVVTIVYRGGDTLTDDVFEKAKAVIREKLVELDANGKLDVKREIIPSSVTSYPSHSCRKFSTSSRYLDSSCHCILDK